MTASAPAAPVERVRLPTLTGLRVIAAFVVFFNHAAGTLYHDDTLNYVMIAVSVSMGHAAVSYFFALSGFVLTWSLRSSDTPRVFLRRRLARILPNHLLTATIGLLLMIAVGAYSNVVTLAPSFLLIHSWIPDLDVVVGTNGPNWSLAGELSYYLLFPLLIPIVMRIHPDRLWRTIYIVCGIAFVIPLLSLLIPKDPVIYDVVPVNRFWFMAFFPPTRFLDFLIGVLMARVVAERRWKPVGNRKLWGIGVGAWILSLAAPAPYLWVAPFLFPIALVLGTFSAVDIQGRTKRLGSRRMVWLGEVTFGFYVIHWIVLHYSREILFDGRSFGYVGGTVFFVTALAASVALGAAVFTYVEKPMYKRFSKSRRAKAARGPDPGPGLHDPVTEPAGAAAPEPAITAGTQTR